MTKDWFEYKLYVYDLDDTLYRETDYLYAAYARIAAACTADKAEQTVYTDYLCRSFREDGRQGLFQRFKERFRVEMSIEEMLLLLRHTECPLRLYETREQEIRTLLGKGKSVVILTNGNPEQQRQKVHNLRLAELFPQIEIIYAAETASKPSPIALLQRIAKEPIEKHEVLLIGDSVTDEQTALYAGVDYKSI